MKSRRTPRAAHFLCVLLFLFASAHASAQVSFSSSIQLAVQHSPRVKVAQDDVVRATAALAEVKDAYIPSLSVGGGLGRSHGITLTVPTIFTVNAQSLVYSASQRNYIRGSRKSLEAALLTLQDVRQQVEEDAADTYLSLNEARQRHQLVMEESTFAERIVTVVTARVDVGFDSGLELKRVRRTALQLRLQELQIADEAALFEEHMTQLTGVAMKAISLVEGSLPAASSFSIVDLSNTERGGPSLAAAEANSVAKTQQALGDSHYLYRPQLSFQAQYGRISPINDVSSYYNLNGNYNTVEAGVTIQLPLFDRAHSARASETMADAMRLHHEAQALRDEQEESRLRMRHAIAELSAKAELAELDLGIAEDQLRIILVQVQSPNGADRNDRQMTPRDELNARIEQKQRSVDVLNTILQLRKAQIGFLRQVGKLDSWIDSVGRNALSTINGPHAR